MLRSGEMDVLTVPDCGSGDYPISLLPEGTSSIFTSCNVVFKVFHKNATLQVQVLSLRVMHLYVRTS